MEQVSGENVNEKFLKEINSTKVDNDQGRDDTRCGFWIFRSEKIQL